MIKMSILLFLEYYNYVDGFYSIVVRYKMNSNTTNIINEDDFFRTFSKLLQERNSPSSLYLRESVM